MPRVCAIISEYNPFHNGHAYHLQQAKEKSGAEYMVALMSGCFTQRGEPALFSPHTRSDIALRCGFDIVLSPPTTVTVREGDSYALQNISILNHLPKITHLAFGAECGDLGELMEIAHIINTPDVKLDTRIKEHLSDGMCSHAEAMTEALYELYGIPRYMTNEPNNILGICYLKALETTKSKIKPILIPRQKSYHALDVDPEFPSATALRSAILRGDWATVKSAVPEASYKIMKKAALSQHISRPENMDIILRYRLAFLKQQDLWSLPDVFEGIENYLFKQSHAAETRKELLSAMSTRSYSQARVSRLLCHAVLGTRKEVWRQLPQHVHILGFRSHASDIVKNLNRTGIQIIDNRRAHKVNHRMLDLDKRADEIWSVTANGSFIGDEHRRTIIL